MAKKTFSPIQSPDRILNQVQASISLAINPILSAALTGYQIISQVSLSAGSNTISHNLGQTLTGYIIVRQRAASTIFDQQDSNATPSSNLILNSSAAVVVDILVF